MNYTRWCPESGVRGERYMKTYFLIQKQRERNHSSDGNFFNPLTSNNKFTNPIPLAEVSLVQLPSAQVLVYSQATAQSSPHLKEKTQNS